MINKYKFRNWKSSAPSFGNDLVLIGVPAKPKGNG